MKIVSLLAGSILFGLVLAGCAGAPTEPPSGALELGDEICLVGMVVDDELIPVEGATVTVSGVESPLHTDASGKFALCPVEAGDYDVRVEKQGYAIGQQAVTIAFETVQITMTLKAISLDVPYHTSQHHVTFVICASYNPIGGVPCTKLVDYVAGTNISSSERFAFPFKIPNPNLADMLIEMVWSSQQFGKDMLFMMQTPPGQAATALSTKYFTMNGGAPLRGWVTAGIKNRCGASECAGVFDAEPNKVTYEGVTAWSDGNSTIPAIRNPVDNSRVLAGTSLYLNHRTEIWMTMFHNREGSREFSALPDN